VWAALATGPLALALACAMPRTVAAIAQPKTPAPTALRSTDPAGVAALFTDLWLRSDAAQADNSTAQAVRALARSRLIAWLRRVDGFSGPWPVRILEASSAKVVLRTKWRRFSMVHCERTIFARRSGDA
jgi:hypothetical protein